MTATVHVIPSHVYSFRYQGSFKDVVGRESFFASCCDDYLKVVVADDDPSLVEVATRYVAPQHVLIEYSTHPRILGYLRARYPRSFIAVRALNIEPLQLLANYASPRRQGPLKLIYGMARLVLSDLACMRRADAVYPISEWETEKYWRRLPGGAHLEWLPYFAPASVVGVGTGSQPRDIIACLPGRVMGYPRSRDMVRHFVHFAERLRRVTTRYRFVITGEDVAGAGLNLPDYITLVGHVPDIAHFMTSVRAIGMLSPLGHGWKTTITDALANGCLPLLHATLFRRTPAIIRELCVEVGSLEDSSLAGILRRIENPPTASDVNDRLRSMSFDILARAFDCPIATPPGGS